MAKEANEKLYLATHKDEIKRRSNCEKEIDSKVKEAISQPSNEASILICQADLQYFVNMLKEHEYEIVEWYESKCIDPMFESDIDNMYLLKFTY